MKGEAKKIIKFLDGSDKRFIIPVYQRNYSWQKKQCEQLFNDLKQLMQKEQSPHFFGSVVSSLADGGGKEDYLIIFSGAILELSTGVFTTELSYPKRRGDNFKHL